MPVAEITETERAYRALSRARRALERMGLAYGSYNRPPEGPWRVKYDALRAKVEVASQAWIASSKIGD